MLDSLAIGSRYFVPRAAQMNGYGWTTVVANPHSGVYVLRYADGTEDTLTDSR